jgi:hypothetical protein
MLVAHETPCRTEDRITLSFASSTSSAVAIERATIKFFARAVLLVV